jgi:hypothetical protein
MLTAAVSGSFHRHMKAITEAVHELAALSVRVLSPADPRVVAQQGEFLFVASDVVRSVRLVQDRHLESIRAADFLWLVCPDGYVGQSASMEIGFAAAANVPIFGTHAPTDLTLRKYVRIVPTLEDALQLASSVLRQTRPKYGLLIDPHTSIEKAHGILERLRHTLTGKTESEPENQVYQDIANLRATIPNFVQ